MRNFQQRLLASMSDLLTKIKTVLIVGLIIVVLGVFTTRNVCWAVSYSVIYSFGPPPDGNSPGGPLLGGKNGVLYGTTTYGGGGPGGIAFSLTPPASPGGLWTKATLHSFLAYPDVLHPNGGLVADANGTLYGTADGFPGGVAAAGVFALSPPPTPGGTWTESILHKFHGTPDGAYPNGVIFGKNGVLYGTTAYGGTGNSVDCATPPLSLRCGTVFALKSTGGPDQILYNFQGPPDGFLPGSNLLFNSNGVFGTTGAGGTGGGTISCGTAFQLNRPSTSGGAWTEVVIYSFGNTPDGCSPSAGFISGQNGVLYGVTRDGGNSAFGTVFSLTPPAVPGQPWTETLLYDFAGIPNDGEYPVGNLVMGANGVLYGATLMGGAAGDGAVFSLTPPATPGGAWTETVLYSFTGAPDGSGPAGLIMVNGVLYGTTFAGGSLGGICSAAGGCGTVFSLVP